MWRRSLFISRKKTRPQNCIDDKLKTSGFGSWGQFDGKITNIFWFLQQFLLMSGQFYANILTGLTNPLFFLISKLKLSVTFQVDQNRSEKLACLKSHKRLVHLTLACSWQWKCCLILKLLAVWRFIIRIDQIFWSIED